MGAPSDSGLRGKTVVTVMSKVLERPVAQDACLVVIHGDQIGRKYVLDSPSILIGRSSRTDIQIDQESVSRNHAKVVNTGKALILRDLGSTNGTYVNDQAIDEHVLRDGDLIAVGRTIFKFLSGSNIERAYHEEIYRLTTTDGLTQVANKRFLLDTLEQEISRSRRYRRELSLALFDIDHFKDVNDRYGHIAGDHVLKGLAQLVRGRIRREDLLGRWGGEEFAIILPEIPLPSARLLAEKVRELVASTPFRFDETAIQVTISAGVTTLEAQHHDAEELMRSADARLYEAKSAGRNCVRG